MNCECPMTNGNRQPTGSCLHSELVIRHSSFETCAAAETDAPMAGQGCIDAQGGH